MSQETYMIVIYGTHMKNDNIFRHFFHVFKIFIFQVFRRVKGQKLVQNDKKVSPLRSISHKPYIA